MDQEETGAMTEAAAQVESAAQHSQAESQYVPVEALQAERRERQKLQEEMQAFKEHMNMLQYQTQSLAKQREEPKEPEYRPDDVLTYADFQKLASGFAQTQTQTLREIKFAQDNPDYAEVIKNHLPEVLKKTPSLRSKLEQTQDFELAYYLAKQSDSYREKAGKEVNPRAQKMLESGSQVGNLSQVGTVAPTSQHKSYKTMSDEEFMKQVQRNMGYV